MNFYFVLYLICLPLLCFKISHSTNNLTSKLRNLIQRKINEYKDSIEDTSVRIQKLGYPLVDYEVETKDGYLIRVHRISHGFRKNGISGKPILVLPGLSCSAMIFVRTNTSIGLFLADQGYDVWLGNSRGDIHYSRHLRYTKRDSEFWDFSWEEMGYHDFTSMIDFVLKSTNNSQLILLSYSVSTIGSFAFLSTYPEYNNKIELHVTLAPMSIVPYQTSVVISAFMTLYDTLVDSYNRFGDKGLLNTLAFNTTMYIAPAICLTLTYELCQFLMSLFVGFSPRSYEQTIGIIAHDLSSGVSIKTFLHILQQIKFKECRRYSYGPDENLRRYGQELPPAFPIEKITTPTVLIHGISDPGCNPLNAEMMSRKLPKAKKVQLNPTMFTHNDFVWSSDTALRDYLNGIILENLKIENMN